MKKQKIDENDFEALDKLAREMTPEKWRPLSPANRRRWRETKRGRPTKAPGTKSVPTMITLEPKLLKLVDRAAKKAGVNRSQYFANVARRDLGLAN